MNDKRRDAFFKKFVKDRNKAFSDVLHKDDLTNFWKYCSKYGLPKPPNERIAKGAVLKAIQGCTDFTQEEKSKALLKCIDLGFNPTLEEVNGNEKTKTLH